MIQSHIDKIQLVISIDMIQLVISIDMIQLVISIDFLIILSVNSMRIYCIYNSMNVCKWYLSGSATENSILLSVLPRLNKIFNQSINMVVHSFLITFQKSAL